MYIIIFIIVVFMILCTMGAKKDKQKEVVANCSQRTPKEPEKRRAKSCKRYDRLTRHKRIWAVLRFMKEFEKLNSSESFYDIDKATANFNQSKERLYDEEFTPNQEDISTAIRFCQYQYTKGSCTHGLSQNDIDRVYDWRSFSYDGHEILLNVGEHFKAYWDNVIANYKRQSDKNKRKEYLIHHLDEMKEKEVFRTIPNSDDLFKELIKHYS